MFLFYMQGGAIIRQARRIAERAGYTPDTGLHTEKAPENKGNDNMKLDDSKYSARLRWNERQYEVALAEIK